MNQDDLQNIRRAIARINDILQTIETEGISSPGFWYAKDRFCAIRDIAQLAADGEFIKAWHDGWDGNEEIIDKWVAKP